MSDYPASNITSPQPFYGESEDKFPDTLFTLPDNSFRIVQCRDFSGMTCWKLQSRVSRTLANSRWNFVCSARSRVALLAGLNSVGASDPTLIAFVSGLPDSVT